MARRLERGQSGQGLDCSSAFDEAHHVEVLLRRSQLHVWQIVQNGSYKRTGPGPTIPTARILADRRQVLETRQTDPHCRYRLTTTQNRNRLEQADRNQNRVENSAERVWLPEGPSPSTTECSTRCQTVPATTLGSTIATEMPLPIERLQPITYSLYRGCGGGVAYQHRNGPISTHRVSHLDNVTADNAYGVASSKTGLILIPAACATALISFGIRQCRSPQTARLHSGRLSLVTRQSISTRSDAARKRSS